MGESLILEALRAPFAWRGGAFLETKPEALLIHALGGLVERVGIKVEKIEDVVNGTMTQAGEQGAKPC